MPPHGAPGTTTSENEDEQSNILRARIDGEDIVIDIRRVTYVHDRQLKQHYGTYLGGLFAAVDRDDTNPAVLGALTWLSRIQAGDKQASLKKILSKFRYGVEYDVAFLNEDGTEISDADEFAGELDNPDVIDIDPIEDDLDDSDPDPKDPASSS